MGVDGEVAAVFAEQSFRSGVAIVAAALLVLTVSAPAAAAPPPGATHTVESGDTLSEIAADYGVSLRSLFALNGLGPDSVIYPGDVILLADDDGAPPEDEDEDEDGGDGSASRTHTVRSGDTLGEIADRQDVSLDSVLDLNGLDRSSIIHPGDVILIPGGSDSGDDASPPAGEPAAGGSHVVSPGDTLGRIADRYDVSLSAIYALNALDSGSIIYPGDVILLPSGASGASEAPRGPAGSTLEIGPNDSGRVVLTYDDCPSSLEETEAVLAYAEANDIGLVIAPTGDCVEMFRSRYGVHLADWARANGQYVINHSVSHRDLTTLNCDDGAAELGEPGVISNFGRPPYGALSSDARCAYAQAGMSPWLWSVDTLDWTGKSEDEVVDFVVGSAGPGDTVLMHLQWNGFSPSAIGRMRDGLASRGLALCAAYPGTSPVDLPPSLPC